ncbi:TspO/MBR family protein [Aurantiacibacter gilvus]|uniref:TspO/MBR family protein n=1 Tax=Aurantiacibacter gilvus TaxID=3139141 RepID=A0ABU9IEA2_9SPHN
MNRLASPAQLRASLIRWALFLVPLVMLLGFLSGQLSGSGAGSPWFQALEKPDLFPPPATFGIVWTALYFMMGLSFAMVCAAWGSRRRGWAVFFFIVQLALNLAWSPAFFAMHDIMLAQIIIVALDVVLLITVVLFFKVRKWAGVLLLPYLAWVLFATLLNYQFLQANPDASEVEESGAIQRIEL